MVFPRTQDLPTQSSKYWAKEKDRYIRQLLISDIQEETGRPLLVYYSRLTEMITHTDSEDISEVFEGLDGGDDKNIDLLIHTPGGGVDAVEKFITVLRQRTESYRVIIPSLAKSGGTVIALSANEILLGVNSEMGPIDPQMKIEGIGMVPCEFVAADESIPQAVRELATNAVERMRKMAKSYLSTGMMSGSDNEKIEETVSKISSSREYMSHGAVIDASEAKSLGLNVTFISPDNSLWRRLWLLYCLYDYDVNVKNIGKICEGEKYSIARPRTS